MVSALLLALIAALQSSGTAAAQVQQPPPAVGNVPAPAAPSSVALDAEQARADQELEQRVLAGRERVVVRGEHAPELLANYCADAIELLFANAVHLATLRELDARIALARDAAARTADENQRLRVEHEYANALRPIDPLRAAAVLRVACAKYASAEVLLCYSQELLLELDVQIGAWNEADAVFTACARTVEQRIQAARTAGDEPGLAAALELRIDVQAQRVAACCRLGLLDVACMENDGLHEAAAELRRLDEARARRSGSAALVSEDVARCLRAAAFTAAFLEVTCQDYTGLLSSIEDLDALNVTLTAADRMRCDYYRAYAHSELERTGAIDDVVLATQLYSDAVASAARLSGSEIPSSDVELDLSIGLLDLWLRRRRLDEARQRMELVEAGLVRTALPGAQGSIARARVAAVRSRLARLQQVGPTQLTRVRDELEREFDEFLRSMEQASPRPGGIGFLHWGSQRELISECIETELALDPTEAGKRRAFELALRAQRLGTFARKLGLGGVTLDDVRTRLLGEQDGLVLILPALERTHVFVVGRTTLEHFRAPDRMRLLQKARAFARVVGTPPELAATAASVNERASEIAARGQEFADALFTPAARELIDRWRGVYLCGLEFLEGPPLDALPWSAGVPFGCAHATSCVPSLAEALRASEAGTNHLPSRFELVLLSSPLHGARIRTEHPELQPLVLDDSEIERLARGFSSSRMLHLYGPAASLAELSRCSHECGALLEVFGHGVPSLHSERPAAIAVSAAPGDEGLLDCDWIEANLDPPPFVALFACGTALGPSRLGDDTAAQLGNSLLFKGARCVLLSRAKLARGAMIALAEAFHAHLAEANVTPAEALRRAREDLRRSSEWSDPFYFGNVSLLGAGLTEIPALHAAACAVRADPRPASANRSWMWILAALALLMIAPAVRRLRAHRK